jgi:hypothetical protein
VHATAVGEMRFVPSYQRSGNWSFRPNTSTPRGAGGTLTLQPNRPDEIKSPESTTPPSPETLRFDATLHPVTPIQKTEAAPSETKLKL